jgi:ubiquinone/menaquinone biosynthesis C-methylase UbiE
MRNQGKDNTNEDTNDSAVEDKAREIFGARASFYVTSPAHADRAVLERVVELARPRPTDLALDVATAAGHTALALAPHVSRVIGVDITPEMLAEARKLQAQRGVENVEFRLASVVDLPFPDETFDVVTCRRAAHHFADIGRALLEMRRVLRPGGRLVIDDRSVPEDDFVDATMNRLDTLHDPSHVRQYRPSEWAEMLGAAGYVVETVEPYTRTRPLSSLTEKASPEDGRSIEALIASLSASESAALGVVERDGEIHSSHWYILIGCRRA